MKHVTFLGEQEPHSIFKQWKVCATSST